MLLVAVCFHCPDMFAAILLLSDYTGIWQLYEQQPKGSRAGI